MPSPRSTMILLLCWSSGGTMVGCSPSLKRIQRYLGLVRHTRMSVRVFPERIGVGNTDCKANKPWMVTTFFSRRIPWQEEGKSKSDTMWAFKIPFCPEQHTFCYCWHQTLASRSYNMTQCQQLSRECFQVFSVGVGCWSTQLPWYGTSTSLTCRWSVLD